MKISNLNESSQVTSVANTNSNKKSGVKQINYKKLALISCEGAAVIGISDMWEKSRIVKDAMKNPHKETFATWCGLVGEVSRKSTKWLAESLKKGRLSWKYVLPSLGASALVGLLAGVSLYFVFDRDKKS